MNYLYRANFMKRSFLSFKWYNQWNKKNEIWKLLDINSKNVLTINYTFQIKLNQSNSFFFYRFYLMDENISPNLIRYKIIIFQWIMKRFNETERVFEFVRKICKNYLPSLLHKITLHFPAIFFCYKFFAYNQINFIRQNLLHWCVCVQMYIVI